MHVIGDMYILDGRNFLDGLRLNLGPTERFELYTTSDELRDTWAPVGWRPYSMLEARTNERWNFYGTRVSVCHSRSSFPGDTSSAQTAQTALRWLQRCTLTHSKCNDPHGKRLPTRLIDVATIRLCETRFWDTAEISASYACLSHCWGSDGHASSVLRTTTATLASHKQKIPIEKLPRTFREAIQFTRALGIPFLWIDSLCIIQDDQLDWENEGAAMADIYRNCHVSLAASRSSNSEGGLFTMQSARRHQVGVVHYPNGSSSPLCARNAPDHNVRHSIYPLARRAWVVQETLLSPRTLCFIGTEVIFECQEVTQCECGGVSEYDKVKGSCQTTDGALDWQSVVERYTRTSLTFGRDTLPALSGLAKQWLSTHSDDVYFAGLWRSTLLRDLVWRRDGSPGCGTQPWRAPSWSWASLDPMCALFDHWRENEIPIVEVVDAHCTPSGADPTGTVASGHMILRGKAFEASLNYTFDDDIGSTHDNDEVEWFEDGDYPNDPYMSSVNLGELDMDCWLDVVTWKPGPYYVADGVKVKLLFIWGPSEVSTYTPSDRDFFWTLLVLKPVSTDTFERIGIVRHWGKYKRKPQWAWPYVHLLGIFNDIPVADYFIV